MRCDVCHGKGRVVSKNCFGQGENHMWLPEIGPCPECFGTGEVSCCEGASREQAMLEATDVNPNEPA